MALGGAFLKRSPDGRRLLHRLFPAGVMAPVSQPSMEFEPLFRAWAPPAELIILMELSPAESAMTGETVLPVVIDVTMVERGMVVTGIAWLRALCC